MDIEYRKKLEAGGIDATGAINRFSGNEDLYEKYLKMFPEENTYNDMLSAKSKNDIKALFEAVHTMKGTSANFGLVRLSSACNELVSAIRADELEGINLLVEKIVMAYNTTIELIG